MLAALGAHAVAFGGEHEFGGDAHQAIETVALAAVALVLASLTFRAVAEAFRPLAADGRRLAFRLAAILPGGGNVVPVTAAIWSLGFGVYTSVEACEGQSLGAAVIVPMLAIAVAAFVQALALRLVVWFVAAAVLALLGLGIPLRGRRPPLLSRRRLIARPPASRSYAHQHGLRAPPITV